MHRRLLVPLAILLVIACQVIPTPPPLKSTLPGRLTPSVTPSPPAIAITPTLPAPVVAPPATESPGGLDPFPPQAASFSSVKINPWQPTVYSGSTDALPIPLDQVANLPLAAGLTNSQRQFLSQNGFLILRTGEAHFAEIRERVSLKYGQPYYLSSDAAYHALQFSFDELLQALEREELRGRLIEVTRATLDQALAYAPSLQGNFLETDMQLAAAYLGVGLRLLDPQATLTPELEARIAPQLRQIMEAGGVQESALFPGFQDDYAAYLPAGHYAGDPELEAYFRGVTWFERVDFKLSDADPNFTPSRLPLIVTLALRRAQTSRGPADQEWAAVDDVLTFLEGPSSSYGPHQCAELMDLVYGRNVAILSLADAPTWQAFLSLSQTLPPPQVNSAFGRFLDEASNARRWRLLGQRSTPDAIILHSLISDRIRVRVRVRTAAQPRDLPSGLDVMAALGSSAAQPALESLGAMSYPNYAEQMQQLQQAAQAQSQAQWLSTASNTWLYALMAGLAPKEDSYPPYMRTPAWGDKSLNSALGAWAEFRHNAHPYTPMPGASNKDNPPASGPAPGYVEPDPQVFYRLAYLAHSLVAGINQRSMRGRGGESPLSLEAQLLGMSSLGTRLQNLGAIAAKELSGQPLSQDDTFLIQSALGPVEERLQHSLEGSASAAPLPPMPVISAVPGSGERLLQVGVGLVDRILVIVPLDGKLYIAQGGVFSYYEFPQQSTELLSDERWQQAITAFPPPALPAWTERFILPYGYPLDVLAFRPGDVYRLTQPGNGLNLHETPSLSAKVLRRLDAGVYVKIIAGPVQADGFTWWQLALDVENDTPGWAVENPIWFERAWGQ